MIEDRTHAPLNRVRAFRLSCSNLLKKEKGMRVIGTCNTSAVPLSVGLKPSDIADRSKRLPPESQAVTGNQTADPPPPLIVPKSMPIIMLGHYLV